MMFKFFSWDVSIRRHRESYIDIVNCTFTHNPGGWRIIYGKEEKEVKGRRESRRQREKGQA